MRFAEKIRELRAQRGLSEVRLAKAASVPFGTLHNYVLETRKPSFVAVLKLSRALGVTCEAFADCEDLADGEPEPTPKARKATAAPKRSRGRPRKAK
jgi:transcriptional regulator with XRE-family HTH domain